MYPKATSEERLLCQDKSGNGKLLSPLIELILELSESVIVVNTVIDWLVVSTQWFMEILQHKFTVRNVILMVLVFGMSSIYGTYSGANTMGGIANTRDLGPMIAGLVGGPLIGLAVGLIGGIHRYFLGGFTALPCFFATVLSGIFAGLVYRVNKCRFIGTTKAIAFAASFELFHMLLILLLAHPFSEAILLVEQIILPMIITNCLGMLIFVVILSDRIRRFNSKNTQRLSDSPRSETLELWGDVDGAATYVHTQLQTRRIGSLPNH